MKVTLYTDPGCPFGFNAQRQELQLMWHYGHAAEIERRMIVLTEETVSFEESFDAELRQEFGDLGPAEVGSGDRGDRGSRGGRGGSGGGGRDRGRGGRDRRR